MTDRELLEAAARAAGITIVDWISTAQGMCPYISDDIPGKVGFLWSPMHDDGDEARLEAVLGMDVEWFGAGVSVCGTMELYSDHSNDRQTARRRAGVRAAAEIGRAS